MSERDFHTYLAAMFEGWGYPSGELAGSTIVGREGIGLDSMAMMELQTRLFRDEGIVLEDDELPAIAAMTVDELIAVLTARRESAKDGSP